MSLGGLSLGFRLGQRPPVAIVDNVLGPRHPVLDDLPVNAVFLGQLVDVGVGDFQKDFALGRLKPFSAEFLGPIVEGDSPGDLGHFVKRTFAVQSVCVIELRASGIGSEQGSHHDVLDMLLTIDSPIFHIVGQLVPVLRRQIVVFAVRIDGGIGSINLGRRIVSEELAEETPFVGSADLLAQHSAGVPIQFGHLLVPFASFHEKLRAFLDPVVPVFDVVPFRRDVVGKVPAVIAPDLQEVWLQENDRFRGGPHLSEVLCFLLLVQIAPQQVRGHTAQAKEHQIHGGTGGIHGTQRTLTQVIVLPQLGKVSA